MQECIIMYNVDQDFQKKIICNVVEKIIKELQS